MKWTEQTCASCAILGDEYTFVFPILNDGRAAAPAVPGIELRAILLRRIDHHQRRGREGYMI